MTEKVNYPLSTGDEAINNARQSEKNQFQEPIKINFKEYLHVYTLLNDMSELATYLYIFWNFQKWIFCSISNWLVITVLQLV